MSPDDMDAIVDDIAVEVSRQAASERIIDPSPRDLARMRSIALAVLTELFRELGNPDGETNRSVFREQGRLHQQLGGSVEELVGYYELAGMGFWRTMLAAIPVESLPVAVVSTVSEALLSFITDVIASTVGGFVDANTESASGLQAMRDRLLEILLGDPPPDPAMLVASSRAAQWTPPARVAVGVVEAPLDGRPESLRYSSVLSGSRRGHTVFVVPADDVDQHLRALGRTEGPRVALGPVVDLAEARASLKVASSLMRLAKRRGDPEGAVLTLDGNELDLLVAGQEAVTNRMAGSVLAPLDALEEERRTVLLETLAAWLNRPDQPSAVAKDLHIHVQTVRYRLRQLRELLGDAVDDPTQRARLLLAVRARQLFAVTPEG